MLKKLKALEGLMGLQPEESEEEEGGGEEEDEEEEYTMEEEDELGAGHQLYYDQNGPGFPFGERKRKMVEREKEGVKKRRTPVCSLFMLGKCPRVRIFAFTLS